MIERTITKSTYAKTGRMIGGNSMLRILICDDDVIMLKKIKSEVEDFFRDSDIRTKIHVFLDANQVSSQILSSCDIALLDIDYENANYNGMDIARKLRAMRRDAIIIFITNFIEYAPEGYEVQAFRYILKKDLKTELKQYIQQAVEQLKLMKETLKIQINGEIIDLPLEDILYLEVQQHNVTAYLKKDVSGKSVKDYCFYASLSELEKKLDNQGFLRIHKSYLVNMRHLKKFQCREALLTNGTVLRVGEKSYADNKKKYLLWKGWH